MKALVIVEYEVDESDGGFFATVMPLFDPPRGLPQARQCWLAIKDKADAVIWLVNGTLTPDEIKSMTLDEYKAMLDSRNAPLDSHDE